MMEAKLDRTKVPGRKQQRELARRKLQARRQGLVLLTCFLAAAAVVVTVLLSPKLESGAGMAIQFDYLSLPMLGSADAPVKIVEFGDFKCPSCRYFSEKIKPRLMQDYIDQGIVSFYFINHTIIGPDSFAAAMAGQSIYHQNQAEFWKFYNAIYTNQGDERVEWAKPDFLVELARNEKLQVDYDKLRQDIESEAFADEVIAQNEKAEKLITGTPTLFINGKKFVDFTNYAALQSEITKAMKSTG
ncbi:thioredoxin domain-containing protein [Paenibacillus sp. MWE-103]|uniref:Thioredoxin domain-containing protein n=1 Tax=Paenibacillus artemisiicola TaxID=1172618 RepID=A0ABS3W8E9_9BACL|nr:thioredoxin domain-containing protein [Paenibacillus artemisiicola]MBO7744415.1 thioredoxin domain-containing protein [Paenibacillus artemisiicola]